MLAELIRRFAGTHPVEKLPRSVFHSWVTNLPNSPVELGILRQGDHGYEILLAQRAPDDKEFPGEPFHWPGSVILPGQTIEQKLQAILDREVAGATVTPPLFINIYQHVVPGSYRQHEICLLFTCLLQSEWNEVMSAKTRAQFFPLDEIPENTIASHKDYCYTLRYWLGAKKALESGDPNWLRLLTPEAHWGIPRSWSLW